MSAAFPKRRLGKAVALNTHYARSYSTSYTLPHTPSYCTHTVDRDCPSPSVCQDSMGQVHQHAFRSRPHFRFDSVTLSPPLAARTQGVVPALVQPHQGE